MPRLLFVLGLPAFLLVLAACGDTAGEPVPRAAALISDEAVATAHTTRLPARDPVEQGIALTQAVYPATREENAAGAIILAPQDVALAFTAMSRVTHMPVNAPLLYLEPDGTLSERVEREMERLRPDGVVQDGKTQVYLIGEAAPSVLPAVEGRLGYKVRHFPSTDPLELSEVLDRWQAALKSDHPDEVVITALDSARSIAHGIGPMGWNAHMGRGFAWVYRDRIPPETHAILKRRFAGAFIYLTGGPDVISDEVARELGQYGLVRRIGGATPEASSAVNAGYKDYGLNWGWWWSAVERQFGWGIAQAGHNYIIANADDLLGAIPAALLGHMGKHGPILLVERGNVPGEVAAYLDMVRPFAANPVKTVFNHAWIIGDQRRISRQVQYDIDRLLRAAAPDPDRADTGDHRPAGARTPEARET